MLYTSGWLLHRVRNNKTTLVTTNNKQRMHSEHASNTRPIGKNGIEEPNEDAY